MTPGTKKPSHPTTIRRIKLSSARLLEEIAGLHDKDIDLGLARFQKLLKRLGNPQDKLPPVVHVAGTNGKGSTIAILRAFFETVGYRVHSFTSPHFLHPRETINLAGQEIDEDSYCTLLQEVIDANKGAPLTVFEAMTATAFLAFSRTRGHILLLETGMGGLGDTTNVIDKPALCAITPISADHKEFLGDSLSDIAAHKAGIIKPDVPVIVAKQDEDAYQVVRDQAKAKKAPLYREGREWFVKKAGQRMVFEGWKQDDDRAWPRPNLQGNHQIQNAGVALACVELLKDSFNLPDEAISNAMTGIDWPGRLEAVPNTAGFSDKWELWLDGGHNEAAASALRSQMKKWHDKPLYLIVGMLKRKDSASFLREIAEKADHVYTVSIPDHPSKKPDKLARKAEKYGGQATPCNDLAEALHRLQDEQTKPGRILICGSLSLVAAYYELQSRT